MCRKGGYTKNIRPPAAITRKEEAANAASYGYKGSLKDAEYDHRISLQLGGDSNGYRTLWVEPVDPAHNEAAHRRLLRQSAQRVCLAGRVRLSKSQP